MLKTPFAGLTELDINESVTTDGGSFTGRDRSIIDFFLERGAKTHRHTGLPGMIDPSVAPSAVVLTSGGTIRGDASFVFGYTIQDAERGESVISPTTTVSTPGPLDEPTNAPVAEIEYDNGGELTIDTYYYGITYVDGDGGETPLGATTSVSRQPGYTEARILLSGLTTDIPGDAAGWRLYRMRSGGDFAYLASGGSASDEFIDDGTIAAVCDDHPPTDNFNTTNSVNRIRVSLPDESTMDDQAAFINLYVSDSGEFDGSVFLEQFPVASGGNTVTYTRLDVLDRQPPDVSTSVGGATKIDPDTEIEDWHWKRPVANAAALPTDEFTEEGDTRVTLDDGVIHVYIDGAWQSGGGGGGGGAVNVNLWGTPYLGGTPLTDSFATDNLAANYEGSPLTETLFDLGVSGGHLVRVADDAPAKIGSPGVFDDPLARIKFHTGTESVSQPPIFAQMMSGDTTTSIRAEWKDSGEFVLTTRDESATEIEQDTAGLVTMDDNTDYWIDIQRIGNDIYGHLYDADPDSNPAIATVTMDVNSTAFEPLIGMSTPVYVGIFIGYSETFTNIQWWDDLVFDGAPLGDTDPMQSATAVENIDFIAGSGIAIDIRESPAGRARVTISLA